MHRFLTILVLVLRVAGPGAGESTAEPQSLVDLRGNALGGYGGPQFKATVLNGQFALYGGGTRISYIESGTENFVSSSALVLDPEVYLHLNITEMMRLCLGTGYRFMILFDELPGRNSWDYSAPAAIIQLRFLAL